MVRDAALVVTPFEAKLLQILHYLLRRGDEQQALDLVFQTTESPTCLTKNAITLIQTTLARGIVRILTYSSGWKIEKSIHDDTILQGRLWERHGPETMALEFSPYSLRLLVWLTAENPQDPRKRWPGSNDLTMGDQILLFLIFSALRSTDLLHRLRQRKIFAQNALCRLFFPTDFISEAAQTLPDFRPWLRGVGSTVLEALQKELSEQYYQAECQKQNIRDWQMLVAVGQAQYETLTAYLDALQTANRLDLTRFLFPVLSKILFPGQTIHWWMRELPTSELRLSERQQCRQSALALPRIVGTLQRWERDARAVGYFEEEYAVSQYWKSVWEEWQGEQLAQFADQLLTEIEALR